MNRANHFGLTADAACGGNPWAATFLDTFRYLIQHASLAERGVKVIMHNTLASSDYGLLDEKSFTSPAPNVYVYAQCLQKNPGGVALLIINADQQRAHEITLPFDAERYTLTATQLLDTAVRLNAKTLQLNSDGDLPQLAGQSTRGGRLSFAPTSITFLTFPNSNNSSCH